MAFMIILMSLCFNPRPHAEGDWIIVSILLQLLVSIHALTRRATRYRFGWSARIVRFNPRPHAEGDVDGFSFSHWELRFQSTPSRGGRLVQFDYGGVSMIVSIHALTRRATAHRDFKIMAAGSFNPRPHAEGDLFFSIK